MTVRGQIISRDGDPLDSASVTLVNNKSEYIGEGVKADNQGRFAITSNFLTGNYLLVSYAGMTELMLDPEDYTGVTYKQIVMFPALLEPVIVTPGGNNAGWWWLIPVLGIGYLVTRKKKKRNTRARNKTRSKRKR